MAKSLFKVLGDQPVGGSKVSIEFEDSQAGKLIQRYNDAPQIPAIADPTGGATIDAEARTAIISILNALRGAGIIAT